MVHKCCTKELSTCALEFRDTKSLCTVLCAKGYPDEYKKNVEIDTNKVSLEKNQFIYHAGTKKTDEGIIVSNGGRVLNITSIGDSFLKIRKKIISNIKKLNWKEGFYRKDIAFKVIKKWELSQVNTKEKKLFNLKTFKLGH